MNFGSFNFLSAFLKQDEKISFTPLEKKAEGAFWDPVGTWVNPVDFEVANQKMEAQLQKYKQNPKGPLKILNLLYLPLLIMLTFTWINHTWFWESIVQNGDAIEGYGISAFLLFLIPCGYRGYVYGIQRDFIKKMIAQHHKWLYNPYDNEGHWSTLVDTFPEIFNKGNDRRKMHDEFWGNLSQKSHLIPFYSGIFQYDVVSGSGKNRRRNTYHETIFAFQLNRKVKSDFMLHPEGSLDRFFRWGNKEIETESSEFNNAFSFTYNGQKDERAMDIVQTLSPAVQTKLLDLKKSEPYFRLLFKESTVVFSTNGKLLPKMHTNFFRKVEIDPRDREALQKRVSGIVDVIKEMAPYLS